MSAFISRNNRNFPYSVVIFTISMTVLVSACRALEESKPGSSVSKLERASTEGKAGIRIKTPEQEALLESARKSKQERQGVRLPCNSLLPTNTNTDNQESLVALLRSLQQQTERIWDRYSPFGVEIASAGPCAMSEGVLKPFKSSNVDLAPEQGGIYAIYDDATGGLVAYIGRSNNIRRRLKEHLSGRGSKSIKMLLEHNHDLSFSFGYSDNPHGAEAAELARLSPPGNRKREIKSLED